MTGPNLDLLPDRGMGRFSDRLPVSVSLLDPGEIRPRSQSQRRLPALLAATALLAAACGGGDAVESDAASTGEAGTSDSGIEEVVPEGTTSADGEEDATASGESSLLFGQFETLAGATFDLGTVAGEDVVLWFWAPW